MNWDEKSTWYVSKLGSGVWRAPSRPLMAAPTSSSRVLPRSMVRASSGGPRADRLSNWLDIDVTDTQTLEYFAALCAGIRLDRCTGDVDVPVSVVAEPSPEPSSRAVAPFVGTRLRDWAAQMPHLALWLALHPCGGAGETTMRSGMARRSKSTEISSFKPGALEFQGPALTDWLVHKRAIEASRYTLPVRCNGSCSKTAT